MLEANEVRLGNWAQETTPTGRIKLFQMTIDFIEALQDEPGIFDGIPLTPEILEKCGLPVMPLHGDNGIKHIHCPNLPKPLIFIFVQDHAILSMRQDVFPELIDLQARVASLHKLQNLYFALTGEELPINL